MQKFIKAGSSIALVVPKEITERFGIKAGEKAELKASADGKTFTYTRMEGEKLTPRQQKVASITLDFINRYRKDFEELKDK